MLAALAPGSLKYKKEPMAKRTPRTKEEEILIWAGVVTQLNRTRANQLLAGAEVPYPLFVLLRHFSHDIAREWSITSLTAAFETGQSGMTKKVQKLLALGLIDSRADDQDGRKKWFSINASGLSQLRAMNKRLLQDQKSHFKGWKSGEIDDLHASLYRLKCYLDDNRRSDQTPDVEGV